MIDLGRVAQIVKKEFTQVLRDRLLRTFLFGPPIVQLILFGYVVTLDVNNIPTAYYDLDRSEQSRELSRRLVASGYFTITRTPSSQGEVRNLIERGEVLCAVEVDHGFGADLGRRIPVSVQVILDGTDSNTATVALSYATIVLGKYGLDLEGARIRAVPSGIDLRTRAWYNPNLRSRNYNVPGVIASIIMLTCLMLTSMAIVREREFGTMEQLMVTPLRPIELILGKTIPFGIIGMADMVLVTVIGVLWFKIPFAGSPLLLFFCTAIYILPVLGIGLFISTIARTQQQALMASNLIFMPMILLSGFTYPVRNMPEFFQYLTHLNPLRYFLVIIRGIILKGNGMSELWPQALMLFIFGVVIVAISAMRFRKRMS